MGFSDILRDLRKEKKLTQKELATYLGLTANSVCEWENQRSEPSMASILKMCTLFEVSSDYLLGRTDDFGAIAAPTISAEEQEILALYSNLDYMGKKLVRQALETLNGGSSSVSVQKNKRS